MHLLMCLLFYVLSAPVQAAEVTSSGVVKTEPRLYRAAKRDVEESAYVPVPIPTPEQLKYEFSKTRYAMMNAQVTLKRVRAMVERAPGVCADIRDAWHDRLSEQEYKQMQSELADLRASLAVREESLTLELVARRVVEPEEDMSPKKRQALLQSYIWTRRELLNLQYDTMDEMRVIAQKVYELRSRLYDGGYTEDNRPEPLDAEPAIHPGHAQKTSKGIM